MYFLPLTLARAALHSRSRPEFRQQALEQLRHELEFDSGLYFDPSPLPLHESGCLGLDQESKARLRASWQQISPEIQALRFRALKQGGVTTDSEAFLRNRQGRTRWDALVARPLGAGSMLLARTRGRAFSTHDRRWLSTLVPVLSACEAVYAEKLPESTRVVSAEGRCVDQRLTKRQREVVEQVARGRTNKEAGEALGISEHTVRNLLVDARSRVEATNRTDLVRLCQMT